MKKSKSIILLFLVFLLCLPSLGLAQAFDQVRFPEKGDTINDQANMLSFQTITQLQHYAQGLLDESDIALWLTTVHFLDGLDIHTYTARLFDYWNLPKNAFLIVLSAGEDSFSSYAGEEIISILSTETQQHLLSAYLEKPYLNFEYDLALSRYIEGLSNYLQKKLSLSLPAFTYEKPSSTVSPTSDTSVLWSLGKLEEAFESSIDDHSSEPRLVNWGQVFFLIILALLIFGNRKQKNMAASAGCLGCGCGPLGWLIALLGLSKFFDKSSSDKDTIYYKDTK